VSTPSLLNFILYSYDLMASYKNYLQIRSPVSYFIRPSKSYGTAPFNLPVVGGGRP